MVGEQKELYHNKSKKKDINFILTVSSFARIIIIIILLYTILVILPKHSRNYLNVNSTILFYMYRFYLILLLIIESDMVLYIHICGFVSLLEI